MVPLPTGSVPAQLGLSFTDGIAEAWAGYCLGHGLPAAQGAGPAVTSPLRSPRPCPALPWAEVGRSLSGQHRAGAQTWYVFVASADQPPLSSLPAPDPGEPGASSPGRLPPGLPALCSECVSASGGHFWNAASLSSPHGPCGSRRVCVHVCRHVCVCSWTPALTAAWW